MSSVSQKLADLQFNLNGLLIKNFLKHCLCNDLKKVAEILESFDETYEEYLTNKETDFELTTNVSVKVNSPKKSSSSGSGRSTRFTDEPQDGKCVHRFASGKNVNKYCSSKLDDNGDGEHCKLHQPKDSADTCCGKKRDGSPCTTKAKHNIDGDMYCGRHVPKDDDAKSKKSDKSVSKKSDKSVSSKKKVIRDESDEESDDESVVPKKKTPPPPPQYSSESEVEDKKKVTKKVVGKKKPVKNDSDSDEEPPKMVKKKPVKNDSDDEPPKMKKRVQKLKIDSDSD